MTKREMRTISKFMTTHPAEWTAVTSLHPSKNQKLVPTWILTLIQLHDEFVVIIIALVYFAIVPWMKPWTGDGWWVRIPLCYISTSSLHFNRRPRRCTEKDKQTISKFVTAHPVTWTAVTSLHQSVNQTLVPIWILTKCYSEFTFEVMHDSALHPLQYLLFSMSHSIFASSKPPGELRLYDTKRRESYWRIWPMMSILQ